MQRPNFGPPPFAGQGAPGPPRRVGPGPMVPNPQAGPTQQQIQQQQAAREEAIRKREEAKARSQKPTDRNLPDNLDDIVGKDEVENYKHMREVERRLDALMMRKRLDVMDDMQSEAKEYGTLRIWISNEVKNQPWQYEGTFDSQAFEFDSGVEPKFRVKIEGRLLDDKEQKEDDQDPTNGSTEEDAEQDGERAAKRQKLSADDTHRNRRKKLSHFFKAIVIDFDRPPKFQNDGYTRIEWKRSENPNTAAEPSKEADFDRLEFERKSDENINIKINLVKDEFPEKYRLNKPLAELLDTEEADRQTVLMGLWEYIKLAGVRMDDDRRQLYCDQRLIQIFGREMIYLPHLPQIVQDHLFDPPPIELTYTIRVDKDFHTSQSQPQYTVYHLRVPLPSTGPNHSSKTLPIDMQALKKITATDDALALICSKITASQAKHNFLTSLSTDPANFIKRWTSSQKRDLDVILGKGAWGEDDWQGAEWRKGGESGVWGSREAVEGVGTYLGKAQR